MRDSVIETLEEYGLSAKDYTSKNEGEIRRMKVEPAFTSFWPERPHASTTN